jgi:tetratricopeptide (TPR) repeat protein
VQLFVRKLNRPGRAGSSPFSPAGFLFLLFPLLLSSQDNSLAEQSHHAKELMAAGRYEEAIPIYQKLVKAVPGNPGLILNLGLAEEMAGHADRSIPQFELVLKAQPDSVPALTSLAMARLQMGKPAPAIAPLSKLLTLQPDNRDARGMLAGALLATDRPEEAAAQYRKLAASDSNDAKAWYGLGSSYEASANNAFQQLSKLGVTSPYWAALAAESRMQQGQYRSAFFFYRHAVEVMPKLRGVHGGLAAVYRKTGHDDWAAVEDRREAELTAQPCAAKTGECYFVAGKILEASRTAAAQPDALFWKTKAFNALALEAFSHLGTLSESPELHAIKADVMKAHKQYKEAAEEWKAALTLAPGDPRLTRELITTLFLGRDYDAAIPMLQDALRSEPSSAGFNFMLGDSLLRTEHPDKAVPYLEAAIRADSHMLAAQASLGFALSQTGRPIEAIPHLEKGLETDDDGSLHYQLARAYQGAGQPDRSRELMSQYQRIAEKNQAAKEEVAKEAEIVAPTQ